MAQSARSSTPLRGEADVSLGVTARELLELCRNRSALSATELERWLLESDFAGPNGELGRLIPTPLAIEVTGDLRFLA